MRIVIEKADFGWVNPQLDDIANSLEADPDLPRDGVWKPLTEDLKELFCQYYLEENRRVRALNTLERMKEALGRVAPWGQIEPALKLLIEHEWLAHVRLEPRRRGKLYRDHILHPAAVCAIGWWLLNRDGPDVVRLEAIAKRLEDLHGKDFPATDWNDATARAWVLASLLHDLLYPLEFLSTLATDQTLAAVTPWCQALRQKAVKGRLTGLTQVFQNAATANRVCSMIRRPAGSHAALGALFLLGGESGYHAATPRRRVFQELAAVAVLNHHSEHRFDIDPSKAPLAFLLALADELHEFGREMLIWSPLSKCRKVEFVAPVTSARLTECRGKFTLNMRLRKDSLMERLEGDGFDRARLAAKPGLARLNNAASGLGISFDAQCE